MIFASLLTNIIAKCLCKTKSETYKDREEGKERGDGRCVGGLQVNSLCFATFLFLPPSSLISSFHTSAARWQSK